MNTQPYEYTHAHHISMSIFERLSQFYLEIYEVGQQKCLTVDRNVVFH
jgi:hypothetical protein